MDTEPRRRFVAEAVVNAICLFVLVRYGLFACVVATVFVFWLQYWPFTLDLTTWYGGLR